MSETKPCPIYCRAAKAPKKTAAGSAIWGFIVGKANEAAGQTPSRAAGGRNTAASGGLVDGCFAHAGRTTVAIPKDGNEAV